MNTIRLSNIALNDFRRFLFDMGCERVATSKGRGGHEKWRKEGIPRPITLQTHVDPVAEQCVKSNLQTLGLTRKDYERWYLSTAKKKKNM